MRATGSGPGFFHNTWSPKRLRRLEIRRKRGGLLSASTVAGNFTVGYIRPASADEAGRAYHVESERGCEAAAP